MNILLIQENGRHDLNREYRECFSLKRAFNFYGHNVDIWGLGHENYYNKPDFNNYDIIFNLENYGDNWLPNFYEINKPLKIFWSIDAHYRGEYPYEKIFREGKYTYLLHSTKDYVKYSHHKWFPNAYDDDLIVPLNVEKNIKFGFCGNYANRKEILEWLNKEYNLHLDIFVIGPDMVKAINSYKCHFNLNIANDINYRSFETIGCGTLLLTNYNPVYEEMNFINEKNCLLYKNQKELIDHINNIDNYLTLEFKNSILNLAKNNTYKKRIINLMKEIL